MKKTLAALALTVTAAFSTAALAQQQPADPYSDPAAAIENRQMVHKLLGTYTNDMAAILMGKKQFDGYKLLTRSNAIHELSQSYFEFFMVPGSYQEGSLAQPAILDNVDDFKDKIRTLEIAAFGLRTAINNRDPKAGKTAFGNVMQACQGCHATYMKQP